ncbi:inner centromere protein B-like isoform X3 [Cololabis saira]|uniref:inner centromere protein B-like isoform X3 n=1 Tax=Cololabis saira TaxID=129043 RepID=UPI002AD1FBE8|nr:inner centromere protein B-like isoform X3 [Cololabis saira]
MNSALMSVRSLMQVFDGKMQEFISEIDNVHMVWLEEIQQEANRMFSRDFNTEPELMPKTPSQKKNSRRKRVSLGHQEENQARRRFSKGKRSNLRGSSVKPLNLIAEDESIPEVSTSETSPTVQPKRTTRKNKQTKPEVVEDEDKLSGNSNKSKKVQNKKPQLEVEEEEQVGRSDNVQDAEIDPQEASIPVPSPPKIPLPKVVVRISSEERLSAELAKMSEASPGRTAATIPIADATQTARRSSVRCSLKLRHSVAGLRHSMTQESVRRASRRSMLKRMAARMGNSTCSSNISEDSSRDTAEEEDAVKEAGPADTVDNTAAEKSEDSSKNKPKINLLVLEPVERITRSVAANSPKLAPPTLFVSEEKVSTPVKRTVVIGKQQTAVGRASTKRKAPDTVEDSPTKRLSPPKKSQSAIRPNMKSFLHTVQKNQLLMMTPNSLGRTSTIKSFIKHTTPLKLDPKMSSGIVTKERYKLEALKIKQQQEEERMRKMEEEKKRKQDELKQKRDERTRRVFEAKVKEEQREEEKKKKIEQKMAQIEGKSDKQRQAEEKAKKKVKRQEELEQKKKLEEEAKKKKMQQEEEKRQQELLAKEEEELKALRALELKRQQERERQAAAERERVEKEKALALQRELEKAAREKEMRELEEKRKALEEKRKLEEQQRLDAKEKALKEKEEAKEKEAAAHNQASANLNVTVDIEKSVLNTPKGKAGGLNVTLDITQSSPQSYVITPKGGNKPAMSKSQEDYGMDQNSDDSTDDESDPRKPIPSWAEGPNLKLIIMKQYFNPPDLESFFGDIEPPNLEDIFYKSKPRYFKRTSSAVWHSPPAGAK